MASVLEEIVPGKVYRVDAVGIPYLVSVLLIRDGGRWCWWTPAGAACAFNKRWPRSEQDRTN